MKLQEANDKLGKKSVSYIMDKGLIATIYKVLLEIKMEKTSNVIKIGKGHE